MNFLTLLIVCLVLIGISMLSVGMGLLLGRRNTIQHGSCSRNLTHDGITPGCGCGVENCCTRQL